MDRNGRTRQARRKTPLFFNEEHFMTESQDYALAVTTIANFNTHSCQEKSRSCRALAVLLSKFVQNVNVRYQKYRKNTRKDKDQTAQIQEEEVPCKASQQTIMIEKKTKESQAQLAQEMLNKLFSPRICKPSATPQLRKSKSLPRRVQPIKHSELRTIDQFPEIPRKQCETIIIPNKKPIKTEQYKKPVFPWIINLVCPKCYCVTYTRDPNIDFDSEPNVLAGLKTCQCNAPQQEKKYTLGTKLFGRPTFHIAIAYNTFYEQLRLSGKVFTSIDDMNPTLPSKRKRQDYEAEKKKQHREEAQTIKKESKNYDRKEMLKEQALNTSSRIEEERGDEEQQICKNEELSPYFGPGS